MRRNYIVIDDPYEIAGDMAKICRKHPDNTQLIIGYYETIIDVLTYLLRETDLNLISCTLMPPEYDGYDESYYLAVSDNKIDIGKSIWEGHEEYLMFNCDGVVYIEEDFENDFLKKNHPNNFVVFGYDDVRDTLEENQPFCFCMDEDKKGFSFCDNTENSNLTFKYRGAESITEDEALKIISNYFN